MQITTGAAEVAVTTDCNRLSPKCKSQPEILGVTPGYNCNRLSPKCKSQQSYLRH